MLRRHEPFAAVAFDRRWNVLMANAPWLRLASLAEPAPGSAARDDHPAEVAPRGPARPAVQHHRHPGDRPGRHAPGASHRGVLSRRRGERSAVAGRRGYFDLTLASRNLSVLFQASFAASPLKRPPDGFANAWSASYAWNSCLIPASVSALSKAA